MIATPLGPSELAAITAAVPTSIGDVPVRGMRGFRVWNLTPIFWGLMPERDSGRMIDIIFPWTFSQGALDEPLPNLTITSLNEPLQARASFAVNFFFGYQMVKDGLPFFKVLLL